MPKKKRPKQKKNSEDQSKASSKSEKSKPESVASEASGASKPGGKPSSATSAKWKKAAKATKQKKARGSQSTGTGGSKKQSIATQNTVSVSSSSASASASASTTPSKAKAIGGGKGNYAYRTYRTENANKAVALAALYQFFSWPPKTKWFISSGYYSDMAWSSLGPSHKPPKFADEKSPLFYSLGVSKLIGDNETGDNKTGVNKTGANKTRANKTGANKTGANKTGANWSPGDVPPENAVAVLDLDEGTTKAQLKKMFPGAKKIQIVTGDDGALGALVNFSDAKEAEKAYADSNLPKKGNRILENAKKKAKGKSKAKAKGKGAKGAAKGAAPADAPASGDWKPGETPPKNAIGLVDLKGNPGKRDIMTLFPNAKGITFVTGADGERGALVTFANAKDAEAAYSNSKLVKKGDRVLGLEKPEAPPRPKKVREENKVDFSMPDTDAEFSNISNLFKFVLYVKQLPKSMTRTKLLKMFEGSVEVDIKGDIGIVKFESTKAAARSYERASKEKYEGNTLIITTYEPKELAGMK